MIKRNFLITEDMDLLLDKAVSKLNLNPDRDKRISRSDLVRIALKKYFKGGN